MLLVTGRVFLGNLLTAALARLFLMGFTICQPFLLLRLINFLTDDTQSINIGYGLLAAYALVYLGIAVRCKSFPDLIAVFLANFEIARSRTHGT